MELGTMGKLICEKWRTTCTGWLNGTCICRPWEQGEEGYDSRCGSHCNRWGTQYLQIPCQNYSSKSYSKLPYISSSRWESISNVLSSPSLLSFERSSSSLRPLASWCGLLGEESDKRPAVLRASSISGSVEGSLVVSPDPSVDSAGTSWIWSSFEQTVLT